MYKNYFKIGWRILLRNKGFSFINIIGLALGMTASLFLLGYVSFEFSYDRFHERLDDIYMVRLDSYKGKALEESSMSSFHSESPAIKELYPQVENYVRLHQANGMMSYHNDNGEVLSYFESNGFYADSSFFSIFSFPLVLGNRNTVLKNPNSMLMSESAAKKYFGNTDPLGKIINLTGWEGGDYVVEGVFKDVPQNSHVRFDFLFAIEKLLNNQQFRKGGWYWENFQNYLLLKPGTDVKELEAGFSRIIDTHLGKELKKANSSKNLILFPLNKIHLYCPIAYDSNGNYQLVYFILTIAFLVVSIAWLNYLNLSTARAVQRAKEIGIRKVMGSERTHLVKQFLFESFFVSFIAIVITALLLVMLKPYFNDLVGKELITDVPGQIGFWLITAFFLSAGIFIAGFYPAWILSSFRPINALKGGFVGIQSGERTRKVMVVLQFTASILLIASTLTIREQIIFMRSQDMGINVKQKLVVRAPRIIGGDSRLNKISAFKNLVMQHPTVKNVASSSEVPGKPIFWAKEFKLVQQSDDDKRVLHVLSVDEDFVTTYGLSLVAGRNFSEQHPSDFGGSVLINETALSVLGIKDPESALDQEIEEFVPQRIIGVVKDFQQESMKKSLTPIVFVFIPWDNDFFTISLESPNIRADVNLIVEAYKKTFPDNAIDYYFLDDFLDQQYKSEEQFWNIFKVFSMLTIFISCMGLLGLSSLVISKRTKEVGIRKVLGSSVAGIVGLLSVDFLKLITIAFFLSIPLTMLVMNEWLEGFARRINIPWWIYIVAGTIAIIVAMVTISSQAIRAAVANPVKSLRSE